MADSLRVDVERFPEAASQWDLLSGHLKTAHDAMDIGLDEGWRFGLLAEGSIDQAHDKIIAALEVALGEGVTRTTAIGDALRAAARDFGLTDAEQAQVLATHQIDLEPS